MRKATPAVLTWPCLPKRSSREYLPFQSLVGFPGLILDDGTRQAYIDQSQTEHGLVQLDLAYLQRDGAIGALPAESATGLTELLRTMEPSTERSIIVSYQTGPISLGLQFTDQEHRPVAYEPLLLEAVAHHLSLRMRWLAMQFSSLAYNTIICLNEPSFSALTSPFCPIDWEYATELLEQVFAGTPGYHGISIGDFGARNKNYHSAPAWRSLLETSVNLILLDVYHSSKTLLAAVDLLPDFFKRPGILAWGLIPADADELARETSISLVDRFEQILHLLTAAGLPQNQILESTLISTSSGLEHLSEAAAEHALQLCAEVSQQLRTKYGLTKER